MVDPVTTSTVFWDLKASEVMKFVSTVVTALAWPLSAFFILRLFKGEILKLIPSLSKLKALGVEAEFNRGLEKAEAGVAKISVTSTTPPSQDVPPTPPASDSTPPPSGPTPPPPGPTKPLGDSPEATRDTAPTKTVTSDFVGTYAVQGPTEPDPIALHANPTGAVMVAWQTLAQALYGYAATLDRPLALLRTFRPKELVLFLENNGLISSDEVGTLMGLIELRNLAAHSSGRTISDAEAKRFNEVAARLTELYQLRTAERQIKLAHGRAINM